MKMRCMVLMLLVSIGCSKAPPSEEGPIAITRAVIIDGNGGSVIEDGTIVIDGGTIQAVGESAAVDVPGNARLINASGMTVMPALADMHVHMVGGWDGVSVDILGYQRYLNALLYAGVTTVLDMGNVMPFTIQMRQEINAGRLVGPRILTSGPLIDGPEPFWPDISFAVTTDEQIPKFVEKLKNANVDFVKAYAGLTEGHIRELVKESSQVGIPVFIHRPRSIPYENLMDTGVEAIAHTPIDISDEAITKMKDNGVACLTTLAVMEVRGLQRFQDKSFLNHPLIQDTTPPWFIDEIMALEPKEERPTERLQSVFVNVKKLHDRGVLLVAGTDAPYPGVFQGEGIHRELELLVEAGLTPIEAITAATKNAAVLMKADDEWGTLAAGKRADLIVINGRPDRNVSESRNLNMVIKDGEILDRTTLKFNISEDAGFRISTPVSSK